MRGSRVVGRRPELHQRDQGQRRARHGSGDSRGRPPRGRVRQVEVRGIAGGRLLRGVAVRQRVGDGHPEDLRFQLRVRPGRRRGDAAEAGGPRAGDRRHAREDLRGPRAGREGAPRIGGSEPGPSDRDGPHLQVPSRGEGAAHPLRRRRKPGAAPHEVQRRRAGSGNPDLADDPQDGRRPAGLPADLERPRGRAAHGREVDRDPRNPFRDVRTALEPEPRDRRGAGRLADPHRPLQRRGSRPADRSRELRRRRDRAGAAFREDRAGEEDPRKAREVSLSRRHRRDRPPLRHGTTSRK